MTKSYAEIDGAFDEATWSTRVSQDTGKIEVRSVLVTAYVSRTKCIPVAVHPRTRAVPGNKVRLRIDLQHLGIPLKQVGEVVGVAFDESVDYIEVEFKLDDGSVVCNKFNHRQLYFPFEPDPGDKVLRNHTISARQVDDDAQPTYEGVVVV